MYVYLAIAAFVVLAVLRVMLTRKDRGRVVGTWKGTDVIVRQEGHFRELVLRQGGDELVQSRQDLRDPLSAGEGAYIDGFHLAVPPGAARSLFLGGGAGIAAMQFARRYPGMAIEVVEHNPFVIEAAERDFGFRLEPELGDAAEFIDQTEHRYDVIVVDLYDAHGMPGAFATEAFLTKLRDRLSDRGAVVVNLLTGADQSAMRAVFPNCRFQEFGANTLAISK